MSYSAAEVFDFVIHGPAISSSEQRCHVRQIVHSAICLTSAPARPPAARLACARAPGDQEQGADALAGGTPGTPEDRPPCRSRNSPAQTIEAQTYTSTCEYTAEWRFYALVGLHKTSYHAYRYIYTFAYPYTMGYNRHSRLLRGWEHGGSRQDKPEPGRPR